VEERVFGEFFNDTWREYRDKVTLHPDFEK
jgi:hypothetical protein